MDRRPTTSMDYDPANDGTALEALWREQQAVAQKRNSYVGRHAKAIQAHYARGMSRHTLTKIYGAEAVSLAIGYTAPPKGEG